MGPTARRPNVHAAGSPIAFLLLATLSPAAHAQISPTDSGVGASGLPGAPIDRAPVFMYGVDAGVGESDNVTLVSKDKVSQTIAASDVDFTAKELTRLLDVNATGRFSYLDFLQNAYGSELVGRFDGTGKAAIIPGTLTWVLQEDFGQSSIDPYAPVTPSNMENVNYASTGPDFFMRLGGVGFVNLSARYTNVQYQTSPFNSNRGLGSLAVGRDISAGASLSLNADFERVMFENTELNTDFDRTSVFGRYQVHGARTDIDADWGVTRISEQGPSTTGGLATLKLSRQLSGAAKLTLTAGRELTDASSSFSTLQNGVIGGAGLGGGGINGTAPAAQSSENYTSNYVSAEWEYHRNRTTLSAGARWEKDLYPGLPSLDVTRPNANLNLQRQLTHALSAEFLGRYYKTDYPNVVVASNTASSNFNDWQIGGGLTWRHGRGLEIRLRYNHDSHVVSAGSSGYSENRVFLTVGYRPGVTAPMAF